MWDDGQKATMNVGIINSLISFLWENAHNDNVINDMAAIAMYYKGLEEE